MEQYTDLTECAQAMRSIRAAKNVFVIIIVLAIAAQIACFSLMRFGDVLKDTSAKNTPMAGMTRMPGSAPTTAPATSPTTAATTKPATKAKASPGSSSFLAGKDIPWQEIFRWALPTTKFMGLAASILLALTMLFGVMVALVCKRPGVAPLISAFYWALMLMTVLIPWQQVYGGDFASGALFNLTEMRQWTAQASTTMDQVVLYARFLAYPALALVLAFIVNAKFIRASRAMAGTSRIV